MPRPDRDAVDKQLAQLAHDRRGEVFGASGRAGIDDDDVIVVKR
jgi:hypothetical protein